MKLFLEDVKDYFRFKPSTGKNIEKFYEEYDFSEFEELALLLVYAIEISDKVLIGQKWRGPFKVTQSPYLDEVIACGTGRDQFINHVRENNDIGISNYENLVHKAISMNYGSLVRFLILEKFSLDTILEGWGAGFEMIYFDGGKFKKVDNITFIVFQGFIDSGTNKYRISPFFAVNYTYDNDILFIAATDFKSMERYNVLPLTMRKEDLSQSNILKRVDFNSRKVCCSFLLELPSGKIESGNIFTEVDKLPGVVSFGFDKEEGTSQTGFRVRIENEDLIYGFIEKVILN